MDQEEESIPPSRPRATIGAVELSEKIYPFVKKNKRWIQYPENADQSVMPKQILQMGDFLHMLRGIQKNLSFTKSLTRQALDIIFDKDHLAMGLSVGDKTSWTSAIEARIRTMCRHTAQAESKGGIGSCIVLYW